MTTTAKMLTVYHLSMSQSERIVWLCEELEIAYELQVFARAPVYSPEALKAIPGNALGTAPVMKDCNGAVTLFESSAIVDYINHRHGGGRLALAPDDANYAHYLQWFHFANATLQSVIGRLMITAAVPGGKDSDMYKRMHERLLTVLRTMDERLGQAPFLGGDRLTAADIMSVFSLSTMRYFVPFDLSDSPHIVAYLGRIAARPAYLRAMHKGDPAMALVMGPHPPPKTLFQMLSDNKTQSKA